MGKWSKSLLEPHGYEPWKSDRAAGALCYIASAMARADSDSYWALNRVRQAAAEVRAWRKSLGAESDRRRVPSHDSRHHLRFAARNVLAADEARTGAVRDLFLRYAEAHLREAARLLTEQIEKEA